MYVFQLKPSFSHWGPNFYPLFLNQKTKNKCWNQAYSNSASTGCNFRTNWPLTYPAREGENINIESECKGVKDFLFFVFDIVGGYSWGLLMIWNLIYWAVFRMKFGSHLSTLAYWSFANCENFDIRPLFTLETIFNWTNSDIIWEFFYKMDV